MALTPEEQLELEQIRSVLQSASKTPSGLKVAGEMASAPFRGWRGLAVGAKTGLETLPQGLREAGEAAITRGAEATKPGFEGATPAEKLVAAAGESIPALPLSIPAAAGALGASTFGEKLAEGAQPKEAAVEGGKMAAVGLVVPKAAQAVGTVLSSTAKGILAAGKGLSRKFVDAVIEELPMWKAAGTNKTVQSAVKSLSTSLEGAKRQAGRAIGAMRKKLGMPDTLKQLEQKILSGEEQVKPLNEVMTEVNTLVSQPGAPKGLEEAIDLIRGLRKSQKFSQKSADPKFQLSSESDALVNQYVAKLDDYIKQNFGDAGLKLRQLQGRYAEVLDGFNEFRTQLATEGTTLAKFQSLAKQGSEDIVGRLRDLKAAIKQVSPKAGPEKLKKVMQEVSSQIYSQSKGLGKAEPIVSGIEAMLGQKTIPTGLKLLDALTKYGPKVLKATPATAKQFKDQF